MLWIMNTEYQGHMSAALARAVWLTYACNLKQPNAERSIAHLNIVY